jgi:hypothetical protein
LREEIWRCETGLGIVPFPSGCKINAFHSRHSTLNFSSSPPGDPPPRLQQLFHDPDIPGFAVEAEQRLGAGWADEEPGAVGEDVLGSNPNGAIFMVAFWKGGNQVLEVKSHTGLAGGLLNCTIMKDE